MAQFLDGTSNDGGSSQVEAGCIHSVDHGQAEIDHRIANSLQLAATMLNHEKRQVEDASARAALDRAVSRLTAISRMHRQLSRDLPDSIVDLAQFVEPFRTELEQSLDTKLDLRIHEVRVHAIVASQICLILNELTANAIKHATREQQPVKVVIRAAQDFLGNVYMMFRDDGPGLPEGFSIEGSRGFGMAFVTSTVEKLDGRICPMLPDGKPGAGFEIVLRGRKAKPAGPNGHENGNGKAATLNMS